MDESITIPFCPYCGTAVSPTDIFCPHCGKSLQPISTSIGRQVYMYVISILLPPLGLLWVQKYFKSPDPKAHMIAWVIIILTVVSIIATVWIGMGYITSVQQQINSINNFGI